MTNLETEPVQFPPPTPTAGPPHDHRWARSDDRIVLGVAGGLGRALAIEPLVIRIGFVVLSLFSGVGILIYAAALCLLADSRTSPPPSLARRVVGVLAVLLSLRWLFNGDATLPDAGWVVAIGLLGAAVALWRGHTPADSRSAPPAVEAQADGDGDSTTDQWETLTTSRPKQPRPPQSPLGLLTIGAATVIGSLVWLLNESARNRGVWAFGWATVVLGAGLLVGAFAGRARWLVIPAIATTIAAVVASALSFAGVGLGHHSGDRSEFIGADSTVAARYRNGVGDFELFVGDYPRDFSTEIDVGVGNLTVIVPENARVQVDARVGIGDIDAFGSTRNGYRRVLNVDNNPSGSTTIKLKLRVGVGEIDVRRGVTFDPPLITTPLPELSPITAGLILRAFGDGTRQFTDGSIEFGDGQRVEADGTYLVPIIAMNPDGSVQLENDAIVQADGTVVSPGGFVIERPDVSAPQTTNYVTVPPIASAPSTITPATAEVQP
jgi:phage shock protein PspC (stress-responsive transcriptional regulator)